MSHRQRRRCKDHVLSPHSIICLLPILIILGIDLLWTGPCPQKAFLSPNALCSLVPMEITLYAPASLLPGAPYSDSWEGATSASVVTGATSVVNIRKSHDPVTVIEIETVSNADTRICMQDWTLEDRSTGLVNMIAHRDTSSVPEACQVMVHPESYAADQVASIRWDLKGGREPPS